MCSETDYAQEKVNFHVLESPILTADALRMIICKRPAPHFDNHEKFRARKGNTVSEARARTQQI